MDTFNLYIIYSALLNSYDRIHDEEITSLNVCTNTITVPYLMVSKGDRRIYVPVRTRLKSSKLNNLFFLQEA